MNKEKKNKFSLKKLLIVIFWLAVWEIADRIVQNRIILCGPLHILSALKDQLTSDDFVEICRASFVRITAGFMLSFIAGFLLALAAYRFTIIKDFLSPVLTMLKTVPMISFVIMLLIWVGNQQLTIYLSFLIVLPLIYTNVLTGLESVDKQMLEMAQVFGISGWKKFLYIYRPAFMPFLLSSCKVSLGLSWKSGIMAEVIATPKPSIGREMYQAKAYLQTPKLFAWTVIVIVFSIIFEKVFLFLLKQLGRPFGGLMGRKD